MALELALAQVDLLVVLKVPAAHESLVTVRVIADEGFACALPFRVINNSTYVIAFVVE